MELPPQYNAKEVEDKIYQLWEKSGFFNPDNLPARHKKPFTIIMPPANANGNLHAGHALVMTIEDIMTRYKRMNGFKALWLPGLDHAGFETQVVYEKKLDAGRHIQTQFFKNLLCARFCFAIYTYLKCCVHDNSVYKRNDNVNT